MHISLGDMYFNGGLPQSFLTGPLFLRVSSRSDLTVKYYLLL
jgi:hypothetical protein